MISPPIYNINNNVRYLARSSTVSAAGNASSNVANSLCCFDAILSLDDDDFRLLFLLPVPVALPLRRFSVLSCAASVLAVHTQAPLLYVKRRAANLLLTNDIL